MSKSIAIFASLLFVTQVWAVLQRISFYEEPNQQGDSITFTKKISNFSDCQKTFLSTAGSFCGSGYLRLYDLPNFGHNSTGFLVPSRCGNKNFAEFNSVRFLGPEDSDTPAIALYEGSGIYSLGGQEYVVTGPAGTDIPFAPIHALSFGNSSWTLFSGKDFNGNSTCFIPNRSDEVYTGEVVLNSSFVVQSVVQGCDMCKFQVANNINIFRNILQ